jgi:hypothetical protein
MCENPYKILNISNNASHDEIKKAYRKIALRSHPDKLNNIIDIDEKKKKIKEFTEATNAYNILLNNDEHNISHIDYNNWEETFDYIMNSQMFKDFINIMIKNTDNIKIVKHVFNLDISYYDYYSKNKKKIRIFLRDCPEPIYIDLDCKKYPTVIINHIDDNDVEHEIIFNLKIVNNNSNYYHIINLNNSIDIVYDMLIDTVEYITGNIREHVFLNKNILLVDIQPFSNKYIFKGMGINNGDFICNFIYTPISKKNWDKISCDDKNNIINIFNRLK